MKRLIDLLAPLALVAGLAACDTWLGEAEDPPLPGRRVSVLAHERIVEPDAAAAGKPIVLPPPQANKDWPQAGGNASHAMHHLAVSDLPKRVWESDAGTGMADRRRLLAQPVEADGRVFTIDSEANVTAFDASTGRQLWQIDLTPDNDSGMGGGLALDEGRLFATTGFAQVVALDPATGKELWRREVAAPLRGAPSARAGRVFAITVENQTVALAAATGKQLWTHSGLGEQASLMGGSSPALDGDVVLVPYSSGELFALKADNGTELWSESLSTLRRTDAVATLTDIRGLPVVDRGRVYAIGNSDMMTAIDLRSGRRVWDKEMGGIQTPWLAGEFLYVLTNTPEVVAMEARTGRVRWVTPLPGWEDMEDKRGRLVWTGPVLVSDRLVVATSNGWAVTVSPYTGKIMGREEMPAGVSIAPIVSGGTLYFLTDDAELVAYR
ncbi:MAG: PQQ-binding-like beta-propeller repeat protein [Alphaproteobacteria bacterium]|nr:PQQ-binding-like beta-propeller repeat protein [Alphaproteobacteria bacterium]